MTQTKPKGAITCPTCHGAGFVNPAEALSEVLAETFAAIPKTGTTTAAKLQARFGTLGTVMQNRLARLYRLGLLERRRESYRLLYSRK